MEFTLFFVSHLPDRQQELDCLIRQFGAPMPLLRHKCKLLDTSPEGEIYAARMELDGNPDETAKATLVRSLMQLAGARGFIPLDSQGSPIFFQPPYGFDIIFYHPEGEPAESLEKIAISIGREMPGHEGQFQIQTHQPEDEPGLYYFLKIRIQDYSPPDARQRHMLACYFRLLLLASAQGFEPVSRTA